MTVIRNPERQRRAPVAFAADAPIDVVLEPLAKASLFDVVGNPVDFLVLRDQIGAIVARADEPRFASEVEDRVARAVVERVRVVIRRAVVQQAALAQFSSQLLVGIFEEFAFLRADLHDAVAVRAKAQDRVVHATERQVLRAVHRRFVRYARAVGVQHEIRQCDEMRPRRARVAPVLLTVQAQLFKAFGERLLVTPPLHQCALEGRQHRQRR